MFTHFSAYHVDESTKNPDRSIAGFIGVIILWRKERQSGVFEILFVAASDHLHPIFYSRILLNGIFKTVIT